MCARFDRVLDAGGMCDFKKSIMPCGISDWDQKKSKELWVIGRLVLDQTKQEVEDACNGSPEISSLLSYC